MTPIMFKSSHLDDAGAYLVKMRRSKPQTPKLCLIGLSRESVCKEMHSAFHYLLLGGDFSEVEVICSSPH